MKHIALAFLLLLGACTTQLGTVATSSAPNISRTQIYELRASYTVIRAGLAIYRSQPFCSNTVPPPCQIAMVAIQIKKADAAAMTALDSLDKVSQSGDRIAIGNAYTVAKAAIDAVAKIKEIYEA